MREFEVATGRAVFNNSADITFKLGDDEMTAKCPTTGQLSLFFRGGQKGGLRSIEALLEFFSDVLTDDRDWRKIETRLRDGMDVDVLSQISNYLIGEWSGRPISPPSVSSPTPNGTGPKSTVKRSVKGRAITSTSR
jgi:hypothetical protein